MFQVCEMLQKLLNIAQNLCDMQSCTFIDMIYLKPAKLKPKKYAVFRLMKGIVTDAPSPIPYQSW